VQKKCTAAAGPLLLQFGVCREPLGNYFFDNTGSINHERRQSSLSLISKNSKTAVTGADGRELFCHNGHQGVGSLQQSPAEAGSLAPASSTTFQLPSFSLRHTVTYRPVVVTGLPAASLLWPSKCPHV